MTQYLSEIKSKCNVIFVYGSPISHEDIIFYTFNLLPSTYMAIKATIHTNLHSINLDDLYDLLCSEELNMAVEHNKEQYPVHLSNNQFALNTRARG